MYRLVPLPEVLPLSDKTDSRYRWSGRGSANRCMVPFGASCSIKQMKTCWLPLKSNCILSNQMMSSFSGHVRLWHLPIEKLTIYVLHAYVVALMIETGIVIILTISDRGTRLPAWANLRGHQQRCQSQRPPRYLWIEIQLKFEFEIVYVPIIQNIMITVKPLT